MNAINPYAPPKAELDLFLERQYWRDGKTLVLRRNSALPPRCVKCNAVTDGEAAVRKLHWGSLLTLHYRKVKLDIPLCATHSRRYRRARSARLTLRWLSLALVAAFFIAPQLSRAFTLSGYFVLIPIALLLGALAQRILSALEQPLKPLRIDADFTRLRGADKTFLDSLLDFPGR
ncbi:hypothetical protein Q9Q94_06585 [Uliginosibacterium sp. 31-16]|uniref:hypothetical protein n=1 Tax=Uliginosibacterium sp. 31-16 TaxID=3068315 RepID=UPI00273D4FA6|nr:hypothetical protein [Uliginosibacterium sp. 31-16]MDP5239187.1 hypothetical protein [Uliginosibacterium sp. 31-16]